jgi:hypothetical protein
MGTIIIGRASLKRVSQRHKKLKSILASLLLKSNLWNDNPTDLFIYECKTLMCVTPHLTSQLIPMVTFKLTRKQIVESNNTAISHTLTTGVGRVLHIVLILLFSRIEL